MYRAKQLTPICRIGRPKNTGDEWATYSKIFTVNGKVEHATLQVEADGVCGIYLNGEFVEAHLGRLPNRTVFVEITSKIRQGENEIKLMLGAGIYQAASHAIHARRGYWINDVAAELKYRTENGEVSVYTDGSWRREADDGIDTPVVCKEITQQEYDRFWKHAALWKEYPEIKEIPTAIKQIAGNAYTERLNTKEPVYAYPKKVLYSNFMPNVENTIAKPTFPAEGEQFVVYDFGQLEVGYTEIEYELEEDAEIIGMFDYSESITDFSPEIFHWSKYKTRNYWPDVMRRMEIHETLKKGRHSFRFIRRRACRYMMMRFVTEKSVKIHECRVLRSMMPVEKKGYFHCNEELFNRIWEIGAYTLQVNRHHELESCPRVEMKFFSGDGAIDGMTEYYTFNDPSIIDASFSFTEPGGAVGLVSDLFGRNNSLWDYPAWRIVMAHNHYRFSGDVVFVKRHYEELKKLMLYLIHKVGSDNLIFQYQVYGDIFYIDSGSVDFTCSCDRLGLKPYMNALLYKSLVDMCELGTVVGEDEEYLTEWQQLAVDVRKAINEKLWSNEMGGYIDLQYPDCFPQDGNVLSILYGIADEKQTKTILESLKKHNWSEWGVRILSQDFNLKHTRGGGRVISPMMCTFEAEARFLKGDSADAMEVIRRCWGTMVKKGAHTFWEFAPNDGESLWPTPAHAWASGCTYLLSAYAAGIRPADVAWNKLLFAPSAELDEFECVVPTAKGLVASNCRIVKGKKVFSLALPGDVALETKIPDGCDVEIIRY